MKHKLKFDYWLLAGCVIVLLVLSSLFNEGFFHSDDGNWMIIRFSAFYQALREGQFPVRLLGRLNHEYGYPVANFLYPGFMYFASILKASGFSFVWSIKLLIVISFLGGFIFCYLWLRNFFSKISSYIGSLFFVLAPYHLYGLYVRGSIGELMAFGFAPVILYTIQKKKLLLSGFLYGLLILSHNTFAFIFTPLLCIYAFMRFGPRALWLVLTGLGVSAFFWIPAVTETSYTVFSTIQIGPWQDYFIDKNPKDYMLIGIIGVLLFIAAICFLIKRRSEESFFFSCIFIISIFFTLSISQPLWSSLFFPNLIQFAWRFLILQVISGAYIFALIIESSGKWKKAASVLAIFLIFGSGFPFVTRYIKDVHEEGFYTTNDDTTTVKNEYMPKWVKNPPTTRPLELVEGEEINELIISDNKSHRVEFSFVANKETTVTLNKIYFPHWVVFVDNKEVPIKYNNPKGVIEFDVEKGNHYVVALFVETPLRIISDTITIATFLVLISITGVKFIKKQTKSHKK